MDWENRAADHQDSDEDVVGDEDEFTPEGTVNLEEPDDDVKKTFQADIDDAKKIEKGDVSSRDKYVKDHYQNWSKSTPDGTNFLHFLADQNKSCQQWVVARAVTKFPELMGALNNEERSPLTLAIHRHNKAFIYAICKNISTPKLSTISEALRIECQRVNKENCVTVLQAAITGSIDTDRILDIIKLVPDEMFSVVDLKGRTPLHLAVECLKTNGDQIRVVKSLIDRGSNALSIRTSDIHGKKLSVYQCHDKKCKARREKCLLLANNNEQIQSPTVPVFGGSLPKRPDFNRVDGSSMDVHKRQSVSNRPHYYSPLSSKPNGQKRSSALMDSHIRTTPSHSISSQPVKVKTKRERINEENEQLSISNEILALLKIELLRNMKPLDALEYIHVPGQNVKELWFDFGQPSSEKVAKSKFKKKFDHLEFDEVLQYVAFPRIELERPDDTHNEERDGYTGRQDMRFFFDWLRGKGVKRIIRVEVDDMECPCHSDESIENALKDLHIEVLDWKRLDLDPATVRRVGSDLREIHLYWSGGNNVLRSWSEKNEGLCMTQSLKKIILTQVQGLELEARTQYNLKAFRERLNDSWVQDAADTKYATDSQNNRMGDLKIKRPLELDIVPFEFLGGQRRQSCQSSEQSTISHPPKSRVDSHKWMECMERFSDSFRQIPELRRKQPDTTLGPVTIALIDDGVDITHSDLRGVNDQNLRGISFDDDWEAELYRVSPYWISVSGHGTLMARLIRRVCPSAIVYVIKVRTIATGNSGKVQIETNSTIKAIHHAISIGAHIISMSWTTKPPENPTEKAEFDRAISEAGSKSILMFCAASDQGLFEDFTYPHASNPALTFRIGAAKATGSAADFVGDGSSFVFPGQDVVLSPTYADACHDRNFEDFPSHTGSSVATALAAGLAAVVYECVRLGIIHTSNPHIKPHGMIHPAMLTEICKKNRMKKCFESIGVNRQSGKPYLEVWNRFDEPGKEIDRFQDAEDEQLRIVSGLARLLLEMT